MIRADLNRIMIVPALIGAAGIAALWVWPLFAPAADPALSCNLEDTGQGPSGRTLALCEILFERQPSTEEWAVIRVVDQARPEGAADHEDHDWACATWGLPTLTRSPQPDRIVVQIMAAPFDGGKPTPGITQAIEVYSVADGSCEWELL